MPESPASAWHQGVGAAGSGLGTAVDAPGAIGIVGAIHVRLQRNGLPPDARAFMSEVLSEALTSRAGSTRE